MPNTELVRFLCDIAGEALANAEDASSERAIAFLDEAEEILLLAMSVLNRRPIQELNTSEAA